MSKRILVILGHHSTNSLCGAFAESYIQGANASGHEVRFMSVGQISFDPWLRNGYESIQALEPDLVKAQNDIIWAQHIVFIYPIWWGAMPALLKGFIDRTFLPGFAFNFKDGSSLWDQLLTGRSAHLLVPMDTPPWYYRWVMRMPGHNLMKRAILGFCGIKPVAVSSFGPVKDSSPEKRQKWLEQVNKFGREV